MYPVLFKYEATKDMVGFWSFAEASRSYLAYMLIGVILLVVLGAWANKQKNGTLSNVARWGAVTGAVTFFAMLLIVILQYSLKNHLRFIQLHTYGVLVAIGFLVGIILAVREAQRTGEESERILDLAFWLLIAAMVGARAGYIFTHWADYAGDFTLKVAVPNSLQWIMWKDFFAQFLQWRIFRLWEGGLFFYGGFLLTGLVCWVFVRIYKIDFWKLADLLIPSVAIGQFFGLVGSLAAGFGYGKASDAPWRIFLRGAERHPTQMYEALGVLAIFFLLLWIRSNKKFHGQAFLWYLILFPALAFGVEIFQSDACLPGLTGASDVCRAMVTHRDVFQFVADFDILSYGQLFSCIAVVTGALLLLVRGSLATQTEA